MTEHLMKFNTQKNKEHFILNIELLYNQDSFYFFVNSLTLYLHLTSKKNLWDLEGTGGLKTKSRVKFQWKKVPSKKNLLLIYYIKVYPYLHQILFVSFSSGKS